MKKTILITGAGTGIGRDAAFALAARGHQVIATTFNEAQADQLRAECTARGQTLQVFKLDITDPADRALVLDSASGQVAATLASPGVLPRPEGWRAIAEYRSAVEALALALESAMSGTAAPA